jgi:hypothetical protein
MKTNRILAILVLAAFAYSCNIAKTCPTYASAQDKAVVCHNR